MEAVKRAKLVRMIDKMNENRDFSKRAGIQNVSVFKKMRDLKVHDRIQDA